ncbi:hypothetical protein NDU88_000820 [Pleurodeles waltl]|uniref:Uncharacterized protein n=1 Tax=Pleurodeles waltl TaxID=8319 RepID=A0AAV7MHX4_PLEWA|nr:hypothetical protein NDU88_000820 [Pleurodeles waltl]
MGKRDGKQPNLTFEGARKVPGHKTASDPDSPDFAHITLAEEQQEVQTMLLELEGRLAAITNKIDSLLQQMDDMKEHLNRQYTQINMVARPISDIEDDAEEQTKLHRNSNPSSKK